MRVIGIDPGTYSFDIYGYNTETNEIFLDVTYRTKLVIENPSVLLEPIENTGKIDYLAAPSGFGFPIKNVHKLDEHDIFEMVLKRPSANQTVGLRKVIAQFQKQSLNAFTIPGVKHLPTIPIHRKINKIDLGTADKLCVAVVGIKDLSERLHKHPSEINCLIIELGAGFSALMTIKNGKIINGIGGTNLIGFQARGSFDSELAYLFGKINKEDIYHGGVSSISGYSDLSPEEIFLLAKKDKRSAWAIELYFESIIKTIVGETYLFKNHEKIDAILISGRLANCNTVQEELSNSLSNIAPVYVMKSYAKVVKRAAQGAAFIAEGVNDGPSKEIIDTLEIKNASGSILDYLFPPPKSIQDENENF